MVINLFMIQVPISHASNLRCPIQVTPESGLQAETHGGSTTGASGLFFFFVVFFFPNIFILISYVKYVPHFLMEATFSNWKFYSGSRREWIMNPAGKSYVCILHEYVQHALKKQPCYQFKEIGNCFFFNFW